MTMQETILNQELANLNLTQVAALQQKRTLAFVNHFVTTTVHFLNSFMKNCERKFMQFERKLEKVEAAMVLLEARLSSIPEINKASPTESQPTEAKSQEVPSESTEKIETVDKHEQSVSTVQNTQTVVEEPVQTPFEYERFVKMVQVGVPLEAVKLKASLEGLDPSLLVKILGK